MSGAAELSVFEAGPGDRERWERFTADGAAAEAAHRWSFHELLREVFGQRVHRLVAARGERWVAVLPLVWQKSLMGRFLTSVPYLNYAGVLGDDGAARAALGAAAGALARRLGAHRLEIRGRDGSDLPLPTWRGKAGYSVALGDGTQSLWDALGAKVRAQIKRPRKEGYAARVVGAAGCEAFYGLLARRWHELGSPVLPLAFFSRARAAFGDDLMFVLVERDERAAAAGALLRAGDTVEISWAAAGREHNRYGVNMLLYWSAMEWAAAHGATRFDLGRSTAGTGNARFKLQWRAEETPLIWNVETAEGRGRAHERGNRKRELMTAAWRRLPGALAGALGPRLAARIPY